MAEESTANNEPAETLTLTQQELREFIDGLRSILVEAITENNAQAMTALLEATFPPMMMKLEQMAIAQVTLANALKTNRRDANATAFAQLLIERALRTEEGIDANAIHVIPAMAYALADEMDLHGRVAEVQAESKGERMDEAAKKAADPKTDTNVLVSQFFGRTAKPGPGKFAPKRAPDKKKH